MNSGEEQQTFGLVKRVFNEFVRDDFSQEGVDEFFRAARHMIFNQPSDHCIVVAVAQDKVVGMIDMKDNRHISLFFVDSSRHRQGIGRALLHHALTHCSRHETGGNEIDVHSSLYAVSIYEKLGFQQTKPEQTINGIRFVEMVKLLKPQR